MTRPATKAIWPNNLRLVTAVACVSTGWTMAACRPSLRQMVVNVACYHSGQKSGMAFKATIHNGASVPVSVVANQVLGGQEHVAPGLVLRLRRSDRHDDEDFSYWPEGDRGAGRTGSIIRRVVVVPPGASHEWPFNASELLSPRTGRRFEGAMDRGEIRAGFNVEETAPGRFPILWTGTVESQRVQVPEDCKPVG